MHPVLISIEKLFTQPNGRWHPATEEQIQMAEERMRLTFPPLLREFLKTYGRAYIDADVSGDIGGLGVIKFNPMFYSLEGFIGACVGKRISRGLLPHNRARLSLTRTSHH